MPVPAFLRLYQEKIYNKKTIQSYNSPVATLYTILPALDATSRN
jgi:hypothetical protein